MRRAVLALALLAAAPAAADPIAAARYAEPTGRYPHAVLGDDLEHGALEVTQASGARQLVRLPEVLVFEDTAPRLADLDGDGAPEVIVVESHAGLGARLAVWGLVEGRLARRAETPHIGTRFRWLAPAGTADLDGDGAMDIAAVDRPHLARILRVWRFETGPDRLVPLAEAPGLSNHRIGETEISGGLRDCGDGPEIVTANADWTQVMATRLTPRGLASRAVAPFTGPESFARALACAG